MRQILRQLGPRYGVGLGLIVVVAIVVTIGKLLPHSDVGNNSGVTLSINGPTPVIDASPDDGVTTFAPPSPPVTSPGAATPRAVATAFASAWLHHNGVTEKAWYDGVVRYCTEDLAAQFVGVDPGDVPAERVIGALTVVNYSSTYVQINIPMDGGTLVLGLQGPHGVWLVDSVDWNRD